MNHLTEERLDLKFRVVTVSDSRTEKTDESGDMMCKLLQDSGRKLSRTLVPNEPGGITGEISSKAVEVFIFIGGTGLGTRDITSRTLRGLSDREIFGFGEIFRARSVTGEAHAILSDASMFVIGRKLIFSLPGSVGAQKTGFELIDKIVDHAYHELNRKT